MIIMTINIVIKSTLLVLNFIVIYDNYIIMKLQLQLMPESDTFSYLPPTPNSMNLVSYTLLIRIRKKACSEYHDSSWQSREIREFRLTGPDTHHQTGFGADKAY